MLAIEKKRLADTLRDGKELPAYLKAMTLYALAYVNYEVFGSDALDKWKGLVEFAQQVEKKCSTYKNDITVGLCSAIGAWTHQRMIGLLLQEAQGMALPGIDALAKAGGTDGAASTRTGPGMALCVTQIALHHDRLRQQWLKAVNLVPSLSKYGFCVYSCIEDMGKTIDRYI